MLGLILLILAGLLIVFRSVILFYSSLTLNNFENPSPPQPTLLYGIPIDSLYLETGRIKLGQTLAKLWTEKGIPPEIIESLDRQYRHILHPKKLRINQPYTFIYSGDSLHKPLYFIYENSPVSYTVFTFEGKPEARKIDKEIKIDTAWLQIKIESSLWKALGNHENGIALASALENIFGWSLDFFALQKDDEFEAIYEKQVCEGNTMGMGKVLAARFSRKNQTISAFYYAPDSNDTYTGYYNNKGENLRRAFLKAPLKYTRISSRYTGSRFHPVLRMYRPHHGMDYAAPSGTPVYSIGDGIVLAVQYSGQAGNSVMIKHNSLYTSMYNHLSRFGDGVIPSARVKQGQVIGYVGSTGLSTGPHLDFRIYKNGKPVNPQTLETPPCEPVPANYLQDYQRHIIKIERVFTKYRKTSQNHLVEKVL